MASEPVASPNPIRFGEDFELDVRAYELRSAGTPLKLKPIPMELLLLLIERRGELVTRDQIVERIWGKGVFLDTDNSINGAISKIRQVLRDDADKPRYIATVSGKGYRFVASVERAPSLVRPMGAVEQPPVGASIIGKKISNYRILQLLGGGGMGVVYKAEDLTLGRQVALKFLPVELASDALGFERLQREARAASALDHPNICSIYQLGEHDGNPFIVMQLLDGQTLREWIESSAALSEELRLKQLLDFAIQIADGLDAAHQNGIIHRDIKPANIFITTRGQAKILDFGVAKFINSQDGLDGATPEGASGTGEMPVIAFPDINLTRTGMSMGTPSYLSPEQARGEQLDPRTDLFSFGVVLYEMATGSRAFPGKTAGVVREAVLNDPIVPIRKLTPGLPAELERITHHALEKDRDSRYQRAAALRYDLQALKASTEKITTPVSKIVPKGSAWGRWAMVTAAACGLIAFGVVCYFYLPKRPKLTDKDTIVLGDFANTTGDAAFDEALRQGLEVELGQSPFLSVISDQKVGDTLRMMGRADQHITSAIGRELCLRTGSAALLGGGISTLGNHYLIDLSAIACSTGEPLAHEQGEAAKKDDVLKTLSQISSSLRFKLGESLPSVQKNEVPVGITTSSLEALKNYGMCVATFREKGETQSIPFCRQAIELDPNFPLAYAVLGISYLNLQEPTLAQEFASKAYELKDRASEPEKLRITADYFGITGDLEKEVSTYELWIKEYPRDDEAHGNLGVDYDILGQNDKALVEAKRALQLASDDINIYQNLVGLYISLNRLDDAKATADKALANHMAGSILHYSLYQIAFLQGQPERMQEQMTWAAGEPASETVMLSTQADSEAYYGKIKAAAEFEQRAVALDVRNDSKESAASWKVDDALRNAEVGDESAARLDAQAALALSSGRDTKISAALALARSGDIADATTLAEELEKDFSTNTMLRVYGLPCVRAAIALQRKKPSEALEDLDISTPYELGSPPPPLSGTIYPAYLRGQAYLMANNGQAAAGEFQKLLDHQGLVLNFVIGALAHLQMGRAYVITGDTVKARSEYQEFLSLWKDADPQTPVFEQARSEYAKLQ